MSIIETIAQRRSIGKMTAERPTRKQIEQILEAGTHAPNHHNAQPWRFFVLAGDARAQVGAIMAESLLARARDLTGEKGQAALNKERNKLLRAPVVIVAAAEYPQQSNVVEIENVEAVAAATENMLLAAEELGLAAMWRTGDAAYDPRIKQWFGLAPEDHIVAFLYLGYPAIPHQERQPIPIERKTTWLGWE
ncbi:MAG TPA: nitroreductase [Ktedonobacteraceae bacterium]|jgi:nitroreductase|nr:nitroreductase [Ktedonobacteraceae bacterium]